MLGAPLLLEQFPSLHPALPHVRLATGLPTPVAALTNLGRTWDLPNLFVKRDDETSDLYGGNKVRKLEWILGHAQSMGRQSVVTSGAWGSHHALATAIFAAELDMRANLVLLPQPANNHVRTNCLASIGTGARLQLVPGVPFLPIGIASAYARSILSGEGMPYRIPMGGSCKRGVIGYVQAVLELGKQVEEGDLPVPDFVYVAAGTCGTMAGLALGLALLADRDDRFGSTEVVGIRVVPRVVTNELRTRSLIRGALRLLRDCGLETDVDAGDCRFRLLAGHLGEGYGHPTERGLEVQGQVRDLEGIEVDPTYTAKALGGLAQFASSGIDRRDAVHLYVHTLNSASITRFVQAGDRSRLPEPLQSDSIRPADAACVR